MKTFSGLTMMVLVLAAVCYGAPTASTPQVRKVDLRQNREFNPWTVWWTTDAYRTAYTWPQFRAELAKLNGKADTDYALRHIGLGSYRLAKGIIMLPPLKPINAAPSSAISSPTKSAAANLQLMARQQELAQKADDLNQQKLALAKRSAELDVKAREAETKERDLEACSKDIAARNEKIGQAINSLSLQKKEFEKERGKLEAQQQKITVSHNQLVRKNTELVETQVQGGSTLLGWGKYLLFGGLFFFLCRWLRQKNRQFKELIESESDLFKRNQNTEARAERINNKALLTDCSLKVKEKELQRAQAIIAIQGKFIEKYFRAFEIPSEVLERLGGKPIPVSIHLLRAESADEVFSPCHSIIKFANMRNHLAKCSACQQVLVEENILPSTLTDSPEKIAGETSEDKVVEAVG